MAFSLLWSRMIHNCALAGMVVVGAVTVLLWKQYGWLNLYEIEPEFILSSIAVVVVSLLSSTPSAQIQKPHKELIWRSLRTANYLWSAALKNSR